MYPCSTEREPQLCAWRNSIFTAAVDSFLDMGVRSSSPMFTRTFDPRQFLRFACGTEPFSDYCLQRGIDFEQLPSWLRREDEYPRWQTALKSLSAAEQARIELELAQVNEMADAVSLEHLIHVADGRDLPPDSIPAGAAQALWFFLHHPSLFQEAFLQQEIAEVDAWRTARAPAGIVIDELPGKQHALTESLKQFFRMQEGTGRFCAVDAYQLKDAFCFVGHISDRLQLLTVFTDEGEQVTQAARPGVPLLFVYYPGDGRLLLKARQRSHERLLGLLQCFGQAVLGVRLDNRCLAPVFRLDLLKRRFDPLPDQSDFVSVRVKALHFVHPGRRGRRRVKLETLSADDQFAILDLLEEHGGSEVVREQLIVVYAELEVTLRIEGGTKRYLIRLWPDRCSLNQTNLGERLSACLRRWGLTYAG